MNDSPIGDHTAAQNPIRTRRVYYIGGFDPRGASYYHRLYREEAGKQAALNGARIEVGKRRKISPLQHAWDIEAEWQGQTVKTDFHYLVWDDIVRHYWETSYIKLFGATLKEYSALVSSGVFGRIRRTHRSFFYSLIYPVTVMLAAGFAGLCLGAITAGILMGAGFSNAVAWLAGLIFLPLSLWAVVKFEERLKTFWLLRTILFLLSWGLSVPEGLNRRMDEFADNIAREQTEHPGDEVLVIGHSVGTLLAVSVVARLLGKPYQHPGLALVTLGQCIPLVSLYPGALELRRDIETVATQAQLPWLDVIARADPMCSYEPDPVEISGIRSVSVSWPQRLDVSIMKMHSSENYKRLRLNKLRLHFQYLMSSELLTDYDYFRLTAGPQRFPFEARKTI